MKDYVLAEGKEKEFVKMAEYLGYDELVFLSGNPKIKATIKITSAKNIFRSNPAKDRQLIESKHAMMIYEFEQEQRKDPTHFRNSGVNHILAKLMKEKGVAYGFSISQILHASPEKQAILFGRIMQNFLLCKKYKVPVVLGSFAQKPEEMRDYKDICALARILGLHGYKA